MPGMAGIYDPEFNIDLDTTKEILTKSVQIDEDHPRVEIFRSQERVHLVSGGRRKITATAFSTNEFHCVIFGKLFPESLNILQDKEKFLAAVIGDSAKYLNEIDGSFLISVWMPQEKEFIIINDCFGTFPLNYYYENNLLLFSSQLDTIKNSIAGLSIDENSIAELLSLGFMLNGKTLLKNVHRLWPGTILRVRQKRIYTQNYFSVSYHPVNNKSIGERLENFSYIFEKSILKRYHPKSSDAAGLSGGYDSRVLWSVLRSMCPQTVAVTFGEKNAADIEIADKLSHLANISHEIYTLSGKDFGRFYEDLSLIASVTEGYSPFDSFLLIPYYEWLQSRYGSLIDGTGSALYRRQIFRKYNYLPGNKQDLAAFIFNNYIQSFYNTPLIKSDFYNTFTPGLYHSLAGYFERIKGKGEAEDLLDIFYLHHFVGFRFSSDTLLQTHYLEAIHPFCDRELYQSITQFSVKERQKMMVHRHLLSRNAKDFESVPLVGSSLIIPYRNFRINRVVFVMLSRLFQKSHMKITPRAFRPRPVFDFNRAFKTFLGKTMSDILSDPATMSRPFWDGTQIIGILEDHMRGVRDNSKALMQIGLVEMLLRRFG